MQELILDEKKYQFDHYRVTDREIVIEARTINRFSNCPNCQTVSSSIHSYYRRRPRDLPIIDRVLRLNLSVRRFRCGNPECSKKHLLND